MSDAFPNIRNSDEELELGNLLDAALKRNPAIAIAFREKAAALLPEMERLLRERNDTPHLVSDADRERMGAINDSILRILQSLLNADSKGN